MKQSIDGIGVFIVNEKYPNIIPNLNPEEHSDSIVVNNELGQFIIPVKKEKEHERITA